MEALVGKSIPIWVARSVQIVFQGMSVRHGQILESPRSARWDIIVELADGTEVLAWVDRPDQNPSGVEAILRQAIDDAGLAEAPPKP